MKSKRLVATKLCWFSLENLEKKKIFKSFGNEIKLFASILNY